MDGRRDHRAARRCSSWDRPCCSSGCSAGGAPSALASALVTGLARWSRDLARWHRHLPRVPRRRPPFRGHACAAEHPGSARGLGLSRDRGPARAARSSLALGCLAVVLSAGTRAGRSRSAVVREPVRHDGRPARDAGGRARRAGAVGDPRPTSPTGRSGAGARAPMLAIAAGVAAIAVALSISTGGLRSSSMTLVNDTRQRRSWSASRCRHRTRPSGSGSIPARPAPGGWTGSGPRARRST